MTISALPRPVLLCILDGWGHREDSKDNAIALADTPNWDRFLTTYPHAMLQTSGLAVGLPDGQMGNSEVGHMNLGAGRVVMQDLPRVDQAVADGSLAKNPALVETIAALKETKGTFHLLGLLSPGGVHSHQDHLVAVARTVASAGIPVCIHAFLDGRDVPPSSALGFMEKFLKDVADMPNIHVSTVSGRYYAMDRDKRWARVQLATEAMMMAEGVPAATPLTAIQASYDSGKTDEFMLPAVITGYQGMQNGDALMMGNFRADRAREILHALADPAFDGFERTRQVSFCALLGMTEYSTDLNALFTALFPAESLTRILGEEVCNAGKTQLRIAETEKYAHVTFFFNGGQEQVFKGEDRILVPSPKVATYDLQPEMSAPEVTEKLVAAIESAKYDLIICNYANGDMVGHTGVLDAAMRAAATVDKGLGKIEAALKAVGGVMLLTADHGNAELMRDQVTGEPYTAHTEGPVDVILVNPPAGTSVLRSGKLADVAPTLLKLLGLPQPKEMTGQALID